MITAVSPHALIKPRGASLAGAAFAPPAQAGPSVDELLAMAGKRPDLTWEDKTSLAGAINAHFTNTPAEMAHALAGEYNSLEGDVRMVGGVPRMAHDAGKTDGLTFAEWARIGAKSGRMLRIDIKDATVFRELDRIVRSLNIPQHRVTWNLTVETPLSAANLPTAQVVALRRRYPDAWISLNIPSYTEFGYTRIGVAARTIGRSKLAIALRADMATLPLINRMKRDMVVNIWNDPSRFSPKDIPAATAQFRQMGVNGMIDIRKR